MVLRYTALNKQRRKYMSYVADKPIEKADEDLLGRSDFAKQFGKSICEYDSKDGLVIGLYGKWG